MKVVFLDFDGPIIPWKLYAGKGFDYIPDADPACVAQVNRITDATGAKIVVSSAWRARGYEAVKRFLKGWGITAEVIGVTPFLGVRKWYPRYDVNGQLDPNSPVRGDEIQAWLDQHPEVDSFVILDDDPDMAHLRPYLVLVPHLSGMDSGLADAAVSKMGIGRIYDRGTLRQMAISDSEPGGGGILPEGCAAE